MSSLAAAKLLTLPVEYLSLTAADCQDDWSVRTLALSKERSVELDARRAPSRSTSDMKPRSKPWREDCRSLCLTFIHLFHYILSIESVSYGHRDNLLFIFVHAGIALLL